MPNKRKPRPEMSQDKPKCRELDFNRLFWLNKAIALDKERLAELEMGNGMPGMSCRDGMDATEIAAVAEQKQLIEKRINEAIDERTKLNNFIENIDDPYMKQVFTMRFVENLIYKDIGRRIGLPSTAIALDVSRFMKRINRPLISEPLHYEYCRAYIDKITDPRMKEIFTMRFVDKVSWDLIARKMGNASGVSVRNQVQRFRRKHNLMCVAKSDIKVNV